jgi:chemotaxis response regulator CheB
MRERDTLGILLVDDDAPRRGRLAKRLRGARNIRLLGVARDGAEALSVLEETRPDLVLMDTTMRRMDGLTTLRFLRDTKGCPVVVLATSAEAECVLDALSLGAIGYLPVEPHDRFAAGGLARYLNGLLDDLEPLKLWRWGEDGNGLAIEIAGVRPGSVGGLGRFLRALPPEMRAIYAPIEAPEWLIIPLARRLHQNSPWRVFAASDGDRLVAGHVFLGSVRAGLLPVVDEDRVRLVARRAWTGLDAALAAIKRSARSDERGGEAVRRIA